MGKVSPSDRQSRNGGRRRKSRNAKNKYLKPGALAQLRDIRASSASKSCTDLGKKRIAVVTKDKGSSPESHQRPNNTDNKSPVPLTPVRFQFAPLLGPSDFLPGLDNFFSTPKTPRAEECESESRLESLPVDLLVNILCHLHHDQLRAVFHVSQKIRKAVVIARQIHFNYTTPDRTRQEMLNSVTPLPTDHWPFRRSKGGSGKGILIMGPHTPKAPKHGPRPPSRLKFTEMKQVAAVLFQESSFSSKCNLVPSVIHKPACKSMASNRVLFYEDELCQAVAQNKLR